jgi:hypothetical protein
MSARAASSFMRGGVADGTKAGYRVGMAIKAFCPSCQRDVYLGHDDTTVCPVCSSSLIETIGQPEDEKV